MTECVGMLLDYWIRTKFKKYSWYISKTKQGTFDVDYFYSPPLMKTILQNMKL